jgi:hypothetical protein
MHFERNSVLNHTIHEILQKTPHSQTGPAGYGTKIAIGILGNKDKNTGSEL